MAPRRPPVPFASTTVSTGVEKAHRQQWGGLVAGVDEAGRGPWAGPVMTAAVILTGPPPPGLTDSKALTAARRAALFEEIMRNHIVAVASSSAATIDAINIRAATLDAMTRAVMGLFERPVGVLVDGRDVPPALLAAGYEGRAIVKGDARVAAIAAASVVAKVMRDRLMEAAATSYPGYGFEVHMGYGTTRHRAALSRLGPSPLHRMSFRPLRQSAGEDTLGEDIADKDMAD